MSETHPPLSARMRKCMEALVCVHQELGLGASVTCAALEVLTGEAFPASLAALAQYGLVLRERSSEGIGYRLSEAGWARFAGVALT